MNEAAVKSKKTDFDSNPSYTPSEVIRLALEMLNLPHCTLMDPCLGSGGLLTGVSLYLDSLSSNSKLTVQTRDEKTKSITVSAISPCFGRDKTEAYRKLDEQSENWFQQEAYQCIFLNPPFGYFDSAEYGFRLENKFLLQAVRSLKENGQCVAIVPNGVLGRESAGAIELRRRLCQNFYITHIVLLPLSSFSAAEVNTSLIIIKKCDGIDKKTEIFDLRDCKPSDQLLESLKSSEPVCKLTYEDLLRNKFILLPEVYKQEDNQVGCMRISINEVRKKIDSLYSLLKHDNNSLFPNSAPELTDKQNLRKLLNLEYDLLSSEFHIFCTERNVPKLRGEQLFYLNTGKKCSEKLKEGPYTLYGAGGAYGTANETNMNTVPVIVIGRVGSSCGNVFKARKQGLITDNAIIVTPRTDILPDILLLLLHSANLSGFRRGSGQPYITQAALYNHEYWYPAPEQQQIFVNLFGRILDDIEGQESKFEVI